MNNKIEIYYDEDGVNKKCSNGFIDILNNNLHKNNFNYDTIINGCVYTIDLKNFTQTNVVTKKVIKMVFKIN